MIYRIKNKVIAYTIPSLWELYVVFGQKGEYKIIDIYLQSEPWTKIELKEWIKIRLKPLYASNGKTSFDNHQKIW